MASNGWLLQFCAIVIYIESGDSSVILTTNKNLPLTEGHSLGFSCLTTGSPVLVKYGSSLETGPLVYWVTVDDRCDKIQHDVKSFNASCDKSNYKFNLEIFSVRKEYHNSNITCQARYDLPNGEFVYHQMDILVQIKGVSLPNTECLENDCSHVARDALTAVVVLLLLIQVIQVITFLVMKKKDIIVFKSKMMRSYEDTMRKKSTGQAYNTMHNSQPDIDKRSCEDTTEEQIYDDIDKPHVYTVVM